MADPSFEKARTLFQQGLRNFEAGAYAQAESQLEASLLLLPGRPSTLINLAAARLKLGRADAALQALDEALGAEPGALDGLAHRGHALLMLGRLDEALACFDHVLAAQPSHDAARFHRAAALQAAGRRLEALEAWRHLAARSPQRADLKLHEAQTLHALGRVDEAMAALEMALALDATLGDAWSQRGTMLKDLGRLEEAATAFEQALANGADEAVNRWFLAAVRGAEAGAAPPDAPPQYVQFLFDDYAQRFDHHLVGTLNYQAPERLVALLRRLHPGRFGAVLDLGCGTGLCAPLLAPLADAIDGVDLAPRMLEQAAARGPYRRLVQSDLVSFMEAEVERYGLVLAADVFIYVGALDGTFAGAARVLQPGGLFAFTVEQAEGAGLELRPSLRYAHGEPYLRALAAAHGFEPMAVEAGPLREDQRLPVPGLYLVLRKR